MSGISTHNRKRRGHAKLAENLRVSLQQLVDFSYTCKDEGVLREADKRINSVLTFALSKTKNEEGLVPRQSPAKRRKLCEPSSTAAKLRDLPQLRRVPKRKSLFEKYKRRVGLFADKVRSRSHLSIQTDGSSTSSSFLSIRSRAAAILRRSKSLMAQKLSKENLSTTSANSAGRKRRHRKLTVSHRKKTMTPDFTPSDSEDCIITGTTTFPPLPYRNRMMTKDDFELLLENGKWLNDNIINCSQNILRKQFPATSGFFDTGLGPTLTYPQADGEFCQILHNTGHWLLVSTINCQGSYVNVFDSMYKSTTEYTEMQCAAIMRTQAPSITFAAQEVQQQKDGSSCGLFAIAYLVELLFGNDPRRATFDETKMRPFLKECLEKDIFLSTFPKKSVAATHSLSIDPLVHSVPVYCHCRMPYNKKHCEGKPELQMAECDRCNNWYNRKCEKIPFQVFTNPGYYWLCSKCA